jgi:hypothetical protein
MSSFRNSLTRWKRGQELSVEKWFRASCGHFIITVGIS